MLFSKCHRFGTKLWHTTAQNPTGNLNFATTLLFFYVFGGWVLREKVLGSICLVVEVLWFGFVGWWQNESGMVECINSTGSSNIRDVNLTETGFLNICYSIALSLSEYSSIFFVSYCLELLTIPIIIIHIHFMAYHRVTFINNLCYC